MSENTSFYNTQSPMAATAQLMQVMQGVRQQQLFQRQQQAQGEAGQAYLQAGDPTDPNFSNNFIQNIQGTGDPYAASMAPAMLTQARQTALFQAQQKNAQAEAVSKNMDNQQKFLSMLNQHMGTLLDDSRLADGADPNEAGNAVIGAAAHFAAEAKSSGIDGVSLNNLLKTVQDLPHMAPDGSVTNLAGLRQDIANTVSQTEQGQKQLAAVMPQYDRVPYTDPHTGVVGSILANKNSMSPPALLGHMPPQSFIPGGLTAEEASKWVPGDLAPGQTPTVVPQIAVARRYGIVGQGSATPGAETPPAPPSGGPLGLGNGVDVQGQPPGPGPMAQQPLAAPRLFNGAPPSPSPGAGPGGGVGPAASLVGIQTQPTELQQNESKKVSDWASGISNRLDASNNVLVNLQSSEAAFNQAVKGGFVGPGSEGYNMIDKALDAFDPSRLKTLFGVATKDDVLSQIKPNDPGAAADVYNKLLTDRSWNTAMANFTGTSATGRITEQEMEQFHKASGNLDMRPGAIQDLFNYLTHTSDILRHQQEFAQQGMTAALGDPQQGIQGDPLKYNVNKLSGDWNKLAQAKGYIDYAPWVAGPKASGGQ